MLAYIKFGDHAKPKPPNCQIKITAKCTAYAVGMSAP